MSRLEKERAKQIQDKCQNLLTQMLRDEDNKYCVDCDAKGPRWASWNLGIFLCIRCAGIHRNLGVHISKVKSVNLDTWTPEQVVSLQQMGNSRARAVYEANLPDNFRRPQNDHSLESFIRAKYEHKKYIAREWVPPPLPKVNWDKELDEEAEKLRKRKKEAQKTSPRKTTLPAVKKGAVVPQLPKPRSSVSPKTNRINHSATQDLLGLDAPANDATSNNGSSGDDIFSSFLSAPPATSSTVANVTSTTATSSDVTKTEEENFFNQPAPSTQDKNKMTKDSILALYSTPSQPVMNSVFGVSGGMYNQQGQLYMQQMQNVPFNSTNAFGNQQAPMPQMNYPQPSMLGVGQMSGSMNGMQSIPSTMQPQMPGATNASSQIMQQGFNNLGNNNGWNGLVGGQNLQPAPGSNPFFNLGTQPQPQNFAQQLPQQMSRMSLNFPSAAGKPAANSLPGQTLSTNLWQ